VKQNPGTPRDFTRSPAKASPIKCTKYTLTNSTDILIDVSNTQIIFRVGGSKIGTYREGTNKI